MKIKNIWLLFYLVSTNGFSQIILPNRETIGVDEGLSQSSVYSLYQDREGFLWIGTAEGLNRYDGKQVKIFKASVNVNEPSNANFIRGRIQEDRRGNIWFSTENGLYVLDKSDYLVKKKFSFNRNKLAGSDYFLCFIDPQDVVWLYSIGNGLSSYNTVSGEFLTTPTGIKLVSKKLTPVNFNVENRNIWFVAHRNDGIYKFNTKLKTVTHLRTNEDLLLIKFKKGGYYLVSQDGIHQYDSATAKTTIIKTEFIDPSTIGDIEEDNFKRLWIATRNDGLWFHDLTTHQTSKVNLKGILSSHTLVQLTTLLIDNSQNLWMGTDAAGVDRFDLNPPGFQLISGSSLGMDEDLFVRSVAEDGDRNIWILSYNNPIIRYDVNKHKKVSNSILEKVNIPRPIFLSKDDHGIIWVANEKSIFAIDKNGRVIDYPNVFQKYDKSVSITKIEIQKEDRIIVTTNYGLHVLRINKSRQLSIVYDFLFVKGADFTVTKEGTIWLTTKNHGLFKLVPASEGKYVKEKNFFKELDINSVHIDCADSNVLWLASDKGLIRFTIDSNNFRVFSEEDGMNNSYVYGILEDSKGRLWCSTNGGLTRFDKATLNFTNYTVNDGLQNNEFNSGAYFKGESGNLYFGGVKGLNWFRPEVIEGDTATVLASITELFVNDVRLSDSILQSKKIQLPYFKNDIAIHFSVFDFSRPNSNKVKFQLKGWDEKSSITYSHQLNYNNLLPGKYKLVFSASASNNHWGKEQSLEIIIHPPFWQQWWFYFGIIVLAIALVASTVWFFLQQKYRTRIANLEKITALERERRRISMEMHDDIGASLTQITLISESAKHLRDNGNALEQIAQTSRLVVRTMSEIIWSLNPDNKSFEQLMSYLRDQLHNLLESSQISYRIELPEKGEFLLSNAFKRNAILVIKEAVNNAVKHSGASEIAVRGVLVNNLFEITIQDNGRGFDAERTMGNGLKNMTKRIAEMNGQLKINATPEEGTTLSFQFSIFA